MTKYQKYLPILAGWQIGLGGAEVQHHWNPQDGIFHTGWVGLALTMAGILLGLAWMTGRTK